MRIHQTASSKGPKECHICQKKFVCLSSHNRIVHLGIRTYRCVECEKTFGKKSGLDRHITTVHQKIRGFKCEADGCHGAFGEKSQLTKHMKTHDKDMSYCNFCKLHFDDIKNHYEKVHEDLTNHCKLCFKRFSKQGSLKLHVKVFHTFEKNFFCDHCPKKGFAERFQLKRHLRRHQDIIQTELNRNTEGEEEDFRDNVVKSGDSSRSFEPIDMKPEQIFIEDQIEVKIDTETLQPTDDVLIEIKSEVISDDEGAREVKDERTDIKTELSSCDIRSDIRFVSDVDIKQMMRIGSDLVIEPYAIKVENSANIPTPDSSNDEFSPKLLLDCHLDDFEDNEAVGCCYGCGKVFADKFELQRHFIEHHRTDFGVSCSKCDKKFSKQDHLKAHFLAAHTENQFNCTKCGRFFRYKSALDRHVKIIHENQRNHVCSICGKTFGLKYDLTQHYETNHDESKKTQRTCPICGKIFSKERNLQMHILAIHNQKSFECEICTKKFSFKSAKDRHIKVVHHNQR